MGETNETDTEWFDRILQSVDPGGIKTALKCPECGSSIHLLAQLGKVGVKESFGVRCVSCGTPIAEVELTDLRDGATLPTDKMGGEEWA